MDERRSIHEREKLLRETIHAQLERLNYEQLQKIYQRIQVMQM